MTSISRKEQYVLGKRYARLAAVQSIYAHEVTSHLQNNSAELLALYANGEMQQEIEGDQQDVKIRLAKQLYEFILTAYHANDEIMQARIKLMGEHLTRGKGIDSLSPLIRAIFHAALIEFMQNEQVPTDVILHEYVSITRQFFDAPEVIGFVNANLEQFAKHIRI